MNFPPEWIVPDWPTPANVKSLITTRLGGVSQGAYANLNLGDHVGDQPEHVQVNRTILTGYLPAAPIWLNQVHGVTIADLDRLDHVLQADGSVTRQTGKVCAVMTADCLPILLCNSAGTVVSAIHAGWRGLLNGVIEAGIQAMLVDPTSMLAYLGPAIGPQAFEVGKEVRAAFVTRDKQAESAFVQQAKDKWLADLYQLARQRLFEQQVSRIYGGTYCTFSQPDKFFSYRRDRETGRMGSLIWLSA